MVPLILPRAGVSEVVSATERCPVRGGAGGAMADVLMRVLSVMGDHRGRARVTLQQVTKCYTKINTTRYLN